MYIVIPTQIHFESFVTCSSTFSFDWVYILSEASLKFVLFWVEFGNGGGSSGE